MRTIAFVSQKGGSGKSTIASSLAVAAHEMQEKVCAIDMDPQGSLMNWGRTRAAGDVEVLAYRPGIRIAAELEIARRRQIDPPFDDDGSGGRRHLRRSRPDRPRERTAGQRRAAPPPGSA